MIHQSTGNNEWKTGYKEGFADGYAQAKREQFLTPYSPGTVFGSPTISWGTGTPLKTAQPATCAGIPTGGLGRYAVNNAPAEHFVTGMTVSSSDC